MKWHKDLYVIYKKGDSSTTGKSKHFRIRTKLQLLYVSAGGTSQDICIPFNHFRIVTNLDKKEFVQITSWYYHFAKDTFDRLLTFKDEMKLKRSELQTKEITAFFEQKPILPNNPKQDSGKITEELS